MRPISKRAARVILEDDIAITAADLESARPNWAKSLDSARTAVVLEMAFQMGVTSLMSFKKFWEALKSREFKEAAAQMLDSSWGTEQFSFSLLISAIMPLVTSLWKRFLCCLLLAYARIFPYFATKSRGCFSLFLLWGERSFVNFWQIDDAIPSQYESHYVYTRVCFCSSSRDSASRQDSCEANGKRHLEVTTIYSPASKLPSLVRKPFSSSL